MGSRMEPPSNQSFYRGSDRILGGVCSGLAEGFHVEVLWVRVAFVLLAFLQGIGLVLYVVLWFLMPDRTGYLLAGRNAFKSMSADIKRAWADLRTQFGGSRPAVTATAPVNAVPTAPTNEGPVASIPGEAVPGTPSGIAPPQAAPRNPSFILGAILIAIGIAFLAANTHFVNWSVIWPVALVAVGIVLLVRNFEKRS
jgi:phage shock protein C